MFFWGSYNFQAPQLTEHSNRPYLRFPVYMPPTPSMMGIESANEDEKLQRVEMHHIKVRLMASGQKHLLALAAVSLNGEEDTNMVLYGIGNNYSGQLGHRVPEYITTFTKLHFENLISAGTAVTSLACGNKHTLIATSSGVVFAAGDNSCDQLGISAKVDGFAPVRDLAHIRTVYAAGNASFALDHKGQLFSWGEAQYGHLGHGDNGERMDPKTLQMIKTNVTAPKLVQWFVRHHVVIIEVSVGRSHLLCRSNADEVYTMGEGFFGKLGTGNVSSAYTPCRLQFPDRAYSEKLCGIAAGDENSLVLRESPVVGAVLYYFGRLSNGDGQLTPIVIAAPTNIKRVFAGRGTQCAALTDDGRLYVWGKHSYPKASNGTPIDATRASPCLVVALEPFQVDSVTLGGTFAIAFASQRRNVSIDIESNGNGGVDYNPRWDVIVPHDERIILGGSKKPALQEEQTYEYAVRAFLGQYLGPTLATKYAMGIPEAPPPTNLSKNAFARIGAHTLGVGQKVRLWMTNIYALGHVVEVLPPGAVKIENNIVSDTKIIKKEPNENEEDENAAYETLQISQQNGNRIRIHWQRDDWQDEEITLYSEDETIDEENPNRWQPMWFLPDPRHPGEFLRE